MKTAIVTINDPNPNYGNRLQNYAVNKVLEEKNMSTTTLYVERQINIKDRIKNIVNKMTFYCFTQDKKLWKLCYYKRIKFYNFNKKYIKSKHIKSFKNLSNQYNYFVVGSDQVWNPSWYDENKKKAYLLSFAKSEQKICFSPSFGISHLPEKWKDYFKSNLLTFNNISVREQAGADIIKELTGKDATVLIDPTLMLSVSDWKQIESKPDKVDFNKEYVLTYFLGDKTEEVSCYINKMAKENKLVVYNLLDYSQPDIYVADPGEFIYLIEHAKIILTDSFHACVFSFLFDKPFQVFERMGKEEDMMSRMYTFLSTMGLERKIYKESINKDQIFECDYTKSKQKLKVQQNLVDEYLKKEFKNNTNGVNSCK